MYLCHTTNSKMYSQTESCRRITFASVRNLCNVCILFIIAVITVDYLCDVVFGSLSMEPTHSPTGSMSAEVLRNSMNRPNDQLHSPKDSLRRRSAHDCHVVHDKLNSCSTLPNYFLYEDRRTDFENAILNFWHVQKAGGASFEHCMVEIYDKRDLPETIRTGRSCNFKLQMLRHADYFKNESYRPVVRGHDAIGTCDFLKEESITDRKCSTFAIFREPIEREVSFYHYVRQIGQTDEPHSLSWEKAYDQTIGEWIRVAGSVMFEAFSNSWEIRRAGDGKAVKDTCRDISNMTSKHNFPVVDDYTRGIVDNLDKHLSVVGLLEDLPATYEMFEAAYGLPFVETCRGVYENKGLYGVDDETALRELKEKTKRELMADKAVMKLLEFDILVYEKAKELFYKQKEVYRKEKENR